MFLLLLAAFVSLSVFLLPKKAKVWGALAAIVAGTTGWVLAAVGAMPVSEGFSLAFGPESASIDRLSLFFLAIVSLGGVTSAIYSKGYLKNYLGDRSGAQISLHYFALAAMTLAMMCVVVCRTAFWFLASWEAMTIASFLLVMFDGHRKEVRKAAINYLILMHVGFVALLTAFALVSAAGLPASFDSLAAYFAGNSPWAVFVLFLAGFGMKAGMFPLHTWLPEAHPAAPSHVSALMSGVMIKLGIYGILRMALAMGDATFVAGVAIFVAGIATGLWGVLFATMQSDMKRLLAYSSIENVGIILIALGIALMARAQGHTTVEMCALGGALLHVFTHSMMKSLLFFGAGNVYTATHTTSIEALGGLAKKMPVTAALMLLGTVAICALPPLGGFVSEFLIYFGLLEGVAGGGSVVGALCGLFVLALIGGIVMVAFTKLYGIVFQGSPRSAACDGAAEVDAARLVASALPAAGILLVGIAPRTFVNVVFDVAGEAAGVGGAAVYADRLAPILGGVTATFAVLVGLVAALLGLRAWLLRRRAVESGPTWGCGFTAADERMQYTGESFTEGLHSIATSIVASTGEGDAVDKGEIFPARHSFSVRRKDRIETLFTTWWVALLRTVNSRVMRLRTGRVNYYVLYALAFMLIILLLSILNLI